jgi:hypothetical protein
MPSCEITAGAADEHPHPSLSGDDPGAQQSGSRPDRRASLIARSANSLPYDRELPTRFTPTRSTTTVLLKPGAFPLQMTDSLGACFDLQVGPIPTPSSKTKKDDTCWTNAIRGCARQPCWWPHRTLIFARTWPSAPARRRAWRRPQACRSRTVGRASAPCGHVVKFGDPNREMPDRPGQAIFEQNL